MACNATFNNISVISWLSVLLMEVPGENHWPAAGHWQTCKLWQTSLLWYQFTTIWHQFPLLIVFWESCLIFIKLFNEWKIDIYSSAWDTFLEKQSSADQSKKIWKWNKLKVFSSKTNKGPKEFSQTIGKGYQYLYMREMNRSCI